MEKIVIIGAGMAGLTCAADLHRAGQSPVVLEKSRGLGGRIATRRADGLRFDHGAQFARAQGAEFARYLDAAIDGGDAATWDAEGRPAVVGLPGMRGLVSPLAQGLDIRFHHQVTSLSRIAGGWQISCGDRFLQAERVVLTAPAPQAQALVRDAAPECATRLAPVRMAPCWAVMLAGAELHGLPDQMRLTDGPIAWICRQSSRPGRPAPQDTWVVHAAPDWSRTHLEQPPEAIPPRLLAHLARLTGHPASHTVASAHRWRYALTEAPLGQPFLATSDQTLFLGGDWCLGARIEAAHTSGMAIAQSLLNHSRWPG